MKSAAGKMSTNCKKAIMRVRMLTLYHKAHCDDKRPRREFIGARLSGVPLRGARQCMESAAIGDDGLGERVVTQHMDVMTAPIQLTRQCTLRRYVSAAVPVCHEYA